MSRWLALAAGSEENIDTLPDNPTKPDTTPNIHPQVAFCRVMSGCQVGVTEKVGDGEFSGRSDNVATETSRRRENPDNDAFEERAAIAEYDGGLSRADAEQLAVECQGYDNVIAFRAAQHRRPSDE